MTTWRDLLDDEVLRTFFTVDGIVTVPDRLRIDNGSIVVDERPLDLPTTLAGQIDYATLAHKIACWIEDRARALVESAPDDQALHDTMVELRAARHERHVAHIKRDALTAARESVAS